jgi:hypothetical protein
MPVYPFKCTQGHHIEVTQGVNDQRPNVCPVKVHTEECEANRSEDNGPCGVECIEDCGADLERIWTPVGFNASWLKHSNQ